MTKKSSETKPEESILKTPFWSSTSKRIKSSWVNSFRIAEKILNMVTLNFFAGALRIVIVEILPFCNVGVSDFCA